MEEDNQCYIKNCNEIYTKECDECGKRMCLEHSFWVDDEHSAGFNTICLNCYAIHLQDMEQFYHDEYLDLVAKYETSLENRVLMRKEYTE